ncbi:MAG TPA: DUF998 domain-containing protein [Stackebrandtia sp.]|uniref:DUF998 domain-containing protein n=1 Tax=Stackebrandtia sp. TaxID=2023065 RepID=UPI002D4AB8D3|nr:DUF998 domain-containing protein [Stackebrandtia sp.]HZE41211.1 DUF998 domain-containing protein [Stackebrandtia sp.]
MRPRVAGIALIACAVTYSTWTVAGWLNPALGGLTSLASELGASNQPWSGFFRGGDVATGVLVLVAVAAMWGRRPRGGWWAMLAFGAATILDAAVCTLVCAPSIDARCEAASEAMELPLHHQGHVVTSTIAVTALLVAAVLFARWRRGATAYVLTGLLVGITAVAVVTMLAEWMDGPVQRVQLVAMSAWLVWLGVVTLRSKRS